MRQCQNPVATAYPVTQNISYEFSCYVFLILASTLARDDVCVSKVLGFG